jgi:hypothetical protein
MRPCNGARLVTLSLYFSVDFFFDFVPLFLYWPWIAQSDSYDRLLAQQLSLLATGGGSATHRRNGDDDRSGFGGTLSSASSVAGEVGGDGGGGGDDHGGLNGGHSSSSGGGGLHLRTEHLTALGGCSLPLTSLTSLSQGLMSGRGRRRNRRNRRRGCADDCRADGPDDPDGSSSARGVTEPSSGYLTEGTAGTHEEDREEEEDDRSHSHSHLFDGLSERDTSAGHDDRDRDRDRMHEETASIDAHPPLSEKAGSVYGGGGSVAGSVCGGWSRAGSAVGDDEVSAAGDDASVAGAAGQRSPSSSSSSASPSPAPSPTCSSSSSASAFSLRYAPRS